MTPEQVTMVQRSFAELGERSEALTQRFYERLFAADPDTQAMFASDPDEQRVKFFEELGAIVDSISRLDTFVERTQALGERHAGYGVRNAHYQLGRDALLGAIGDTEDPSPEVLEAWALAYNLVAETMMRGGRVGSH